MQSLNDILTTIRERTPNEQGVNLTIGEEILRDPDSVADVSIKSFANRVGVSEPSVIRYCRSIGCDGFKEFKKRLTQSLVIEQKFNKMDRSVSEGEPRSLTGDERFERMSRSVANALRTVTNTENFERIDDAARLLSGSHHILALGVGGSSAVIAAEAQNRFFRLGLKAISQSDGYLQRMSAATLKKGDVLLIVSSSGQPASLVESAEIARGYGASVIALAPFASPLTRQCDVVVPIELDTDIPYHQPNPVRFAQLFVLDCIADRVALIIGRPAVESLRRVSAAISSLQTIVPYQPTGD